jgi:hypothetical protein
MLLSEEKLERLHERFPYPRFSKDEYRRRYENLREMMRAMKLDCVLIIGGSAAYGRLWFNFRYITNMMGKAEMANYCFSRRRASRASFSGRAVLWTARCWRAQR